MSKAQLTQAIKQLEEKKSDLLSEINKIDSGIKELKARIRSLEPEDSVSSILKDLNLDSDKKKSKDLPKSKELLDKKAPKSEDSVLKATKEPKDTLAIYSLSDGEYLALTTYARGLNAYLGKVLSSMNIDKNKVNMVHKATYKNAETTWSSFVKEYSDYVKIDHKNSKVFTIKGATITRIITTLEQHQC